MYSVRCYKNVLLIDDFIINNFITFNFCYHFYVFAVTKPKRNMEKVFIGVNNGKRNII